MPVTDVAERVPSLKDRVRAAPARLLLSLVSGFGGFLVIYALGQLSSSMHVALLIAPFGASCVLVFALPHSPLAQPKNVIAGHLVSATAGLTVASLLGHGPLALGLGVGLAIAALQFTDTLHPPAGADPIVILAAGASWGLLVLPTLAGCVAITAAGWSYHRWISGRGYPLRGKATRR